MEGYPVEPKSFFSSWIENEYYTNIDVDLQWNLL
jgi:hypothetical protein